MVSKAVEEQADLGSTTDLFSLGNTPINIVQLRSELRKYPNKQVAAELEHGFECGFSLNYTGSRIPRDSKNLKTTSDYPEIVRQKIKAEIAAGRVRGPFPCRPISTLRTSPIGLVAKKTPGEFRLIHHLSYPEGNSLNDFIDPDLCSVQYTKFEEAIHMIQDMGHGCLLGKADIKSAFRLLPVYPADFDQLGFTFEGQFYFDLCMPFGCSLSCATWEKVSTFLEYLVKQDSPVGDLKHYVDDFLFGGKPLTTDCLSIMHCFFRICARLGIPVATEKTEWPTTILVYLGLEIDSEKMEVRMPHVKIIEIISKIVAVKCEKKVTLKVMQQLIGVLNFATRVIVPGRPFLRRLINATRGLSKPFHHTRVTQDMLKDLDMWLLFFRNFNGVSVFHDRFWVNNEDVQLFTDSAAGKGLGFGALFQCKWTCGIWPDSWHNSGLTDDITVLELFPILVSLVIWGRQLQNKKILFLCDNQAVVYILNSMTSKSDRVMVLVRALTMECLKHNLVIRGSHIFGVNNKLCDMLSRSQVQQFHLVAPYVEDQPEVIPDYLWQIFD